jgi:hypothetical protein
MDHSACTRCETPIEAGDLRCAICGEVTPVQERPVAELVVKIHRCPGCGAGITYDAESRQPRCGFCDTALEVEEVHDPVEQTGHHLPFTVEPAAAKAAMRRWLGGLGFFRPSDLRTEARLESIRPLFWVAWVFDAEATISWTADSNAGSRRSSWAPHAGQVEMVFDDILVSASRGLSDDEAVHLAAGFDLRTNQPGAPQTTRRSGANEILIEHFDVQRSLARRKILEAIDRLAAARVERDHVPGSHHRNVHAVALLRRLVTRRFALPTYVLAYRYKEALYRVVVNGQNATCIHGSAPYSPLKIVAVVVLVVFAILLVLAMAMGR